MGARRFPRVGEAAECKKGRRLLKKFAERRGVGEGGCTLRPPPVPTRGAFLSVPRTPASVHDSKRRDLLRFVDEARNLVAHDKRRAVRLELLFGAGQLRLDAADDLDCLCVDQVVVLRASKKPA